MGVYHGWKTQLLLLCVLSRFFNITLCWIHLLSPGRPRSKWEADITSGSLGDLEVKNLGVSEGQWLVHCGIKSQMARPKTSSI